MTVSKPFNLSVPQFPPSLQEKGFDEYLYIRWFHNQMVFHLWMAAERETGGFSHLRTVTWRGHRACCSNSHRPLGGRRGRTCEVRHGGTWQEEPVRWRAVRASGGTSRWELGKHNLNCVPLVLPRVWWVSAIIYNQDHRGEESQNNYKEVKHDYRRAAWRKRAKEGEKERNHFCRSICLVICKTTGWNEREWK